MDWLKKMLKLAMLELAEVLAFHNQRSETALCGQQRLGKTMAKVSRSSEGLETVSDCQMFQAKYSETETAFPQYPQAFSRQPANQ